MFTRLVKYTSVGVLASGTLGVGYFGLKYNERKQFIASVNNKLLEPVTSVCVKSLLLEKTKNIDGIGEKLMSLKGNEYGIQECYEAKDWSAFIYSAGRWMKEGVLSREEAEAIQAQSCLNLFELTPQNSYWTEKSVSVLLDSLEETTNKDSYQNNIILLALIKEAQSQLQKTKIICNDGTQYEKRIMLPEQKGYKFRNTVLFMYGTDYCQVVSKILDLTKTGNTGRYSELSLPKTAQLFAVITAGDETSPSYKRKMAKLYRNSSDKEFKSKIGKLLFNMNGVYCFDIDALNYGDDDVLLSLYENIQYPHCSHASIIHCRMILLKHLVSNGHGGAELEMSKFVESEEESERLVKSAHNKGYYIYKSATEEDVQEKNEKVAFLAHKQNLITLNELEEWFEQKPDQKILPAAIGEIYLNQDQYQKAKIWFSIATQNGNQNVRKLLQVAEILSVSETSI